LFKDAVLYCDVDKISPSMLITSEDDKKYLMSLLELNMRQFLLIVLTSSREWKS
jgi:hypothetical protein